MFQVPFCQVFALIHMENSKIKGNVYRIGIPCKFGDLFHYISINIDTFAVRNRRKSSIDKPSE